MFIRHSGRQQYMTKKQLYKGRTNKSNELTNVLTDKLHEYD